jgi:aldehyde:ferredoxin oxidoreductase
MALAYATSDRGACHLRSTFFRAELSGMIHMDQIEGKAKLFLDYEDRLTLHDALVICRFFRDLYVWDGLKTIIKGTTGMDLNETGLKKIASNIVNLTRQFNLREGMTWKDDTLPKRLLEEKIGGKGIVADDLNRMIQDYYQLRGWSREGIPLEE